MKLFFLSVVLFFFPYSLFSGPIHISHSTKKISLENQMEVLEDTRGVLSIEDILMENYAENTFRSNNQKTNFGFTDSVFWVRFTLVQSELDEKNVILHLANHSIDSIMFYNVVGSEKIINKKIITGDTTFFGTREISHREFPFRLNLKRGQVNTVYFRIKTRSAVLLPFLLFDEETFFANSLELEIVHGIYYGFLIGLFIYNLLIYLQSRDSVYFFYLAYVFSYALLHSVIYGHAFQFFWPSLVFWNNLSFSFFIYLSIIFASLLTKSFLKTHIYSPLFDRFYSLLGLVSFGLIVLSFFMDYSISSRISMIFGLILSISIIFSSLRVWKRKFKPARYFLVAWSSFILGVILSELNVFGFISDNFITLYGIEFASLVQVLLLSYSLTDKINEIKKESQEATIRTLKYQESTKQELELRVKERAAELNRYITALKKDLQMASSIQFNILPKRMLEFEKFRVISQYIPLDKVGGDFYDIHQFSENKLRIFIADATGHGVQAALVTMSIKSEYDSLKNILLNPSELLEELHNRFKEIYKNMRVYFTAMVFDIDLAKEKAVYSSAGHPIQYMIRDQKLIDLPRTGHIMGMTLNSVFKEIQIDFFPGDRLLLFTDGLYEEFNNEKEQYGDERLKEVILKYIHKPVKEIIFCILRDLERYLGDKHKQDDITIVGVET